MFVQRGLCHRRVHVVEHTEQQVERVEQVLLGRGQLLCKMERGNYRIYCTFIDMQFFEGFVLGGAVCQTLVC
jgi:hypothetical protein